MEILLLLPLLILAVCAAVLIAQAAWSWVWLRVADAYDRYGVWRQNIREDSDRAAWERYNQARKREFLRRLAAKIGAGEASGLPDSEMVEAQRQTPVLRRLVEVEIPEMTLRCAKIHRLAALAAGAVFMQEVAYEPECLALRQGVVDLEEVAVDMIGGYTRLLDSEPLLQNLIVLRKRILPTCKNCPYLQYTVAEAPPLCPSAEIARIRCENREAHDGRKQKNR